MLFELDRIRQAREYYDNNKNTKNNRMLELGELQKTLTTLVQGKSDVFLYGNKCSGKTHLATSVLNNVLGQQKYIKIKCIFISDRSSLLYLFTSSLKELFAKLDSSFIYSHDNFLKCQSEEDFNYGLELWLSKLNKFFKNYEELCRKISRVYVFFDHIEDFNLSENCLKQFYFAFKTQVKILKFSFFFCGIAFNSSYFNTSQPLRYIPSFVMPCPKQDEIIRNIVKQSDLAKMYYKSGNAQLIKMVKHIQTILINAFQSIEYQIQRIVSITQCFLSYVQENIKNEPQEAKKWLEKRQDQQKKMLDRLKQYGAVTLERAFDFEVKKQTGIKQTQQVQPTFYLQNYPALICTSLGICNGFPESEDKNRFIDMRKTKSNREKNKMKTYAQDIFKIDHKKIRHSKQRIISVAQVLQEQSITTKRLKQRDLPHHTLDYFGCIEYLREEGYMNSYHHKGKFGGTVSGQPKESQIKDFMRKVNLSYKQFTGRDE